MNPFGLAATALVVWGIVAHLVADWLLQNDWMAQHKAERWRLLIRVVDGWRIRRSEEWVPARSAEIPDGARWFERHPAAYVHAGIHAALLAPVFGWPALVLGLAHLVIDTRKPIEWWGRVIRQTPPANRVALICSDYAEWDRAVLTTVERRADGRDPPHPVTLYDVGTEVRFWTDQVAHIACIAVAALLVTL